jgi:pilus assembly protein CpaF
MWSVQLQDSKGQISQTDFAAGKVRIGRNGECDVRLSGWRVSDRHAELFVSNDQGFLRDLGSSVGTLVNGKQIKLHGPLTPADRIQIGPYLLMAVWSSQAKASQPASLDNSVAEAKPQTPASTSAYMMQSRVAPAPMASAALQQSSPRSPQSAFGTPPAATPEPTRYVSSGAAASAGASNVLPLASAGAASSRLATAPATATQDDSFIWRRILQDRLLAAFDVRRVDVHRMADSELRMRTEQVIGELIAGMPEIPPQIDRAALLAAVRDEAIGLGLLEPLLADASVTEIMVNRADEVFVERGGVLERYPVAFTSDRAVTGIIERIVAPIGRRIDESSPMVDARLKDGSRVNAVIPPLALKGPSITIRKFSKRKLDAQDLIHFGSANAQMVEFLRVAVEHRKNVVISGGTGSGKTTLLNILSNFIPRGERIVTIEDAAELQLSHPNLVSLESRPANIEGKGQIAIRDLVRNSLRMRPDRIVVGECRGGEALDMLQAMNTGHDGSLTTAHANNPRDMLSRIETMVLMAGLELPVSAIREQIASAIDIVVQQTRFACGTRKVTHICEVTGVESGRIQLATIFEFNQTGLDSAGKTKGEFNGCGFVPEFYDSLRRIGVPLNLDIFERREVEGARA